MQIPLAGDIVHLYRWGQLTSTLMFDDGQLTAVAQKIFSTPKLKHLTTDGEYRVGRRQSSRSVKTWLKRKIVFGLSHFFGVPHFSFHS